MPDYLRIATEEAFAPPEILDPSPLLTGDDLIAMGFRPGPKFRSILESIRDAQLNLELRSRDEAVAVAKIQWNQ